MPNIFVRNLAFSDFTGIAMLRVFAGDEILSTGSSVIERANGRTLYETKEVASSTLDDFSSENDLQALNLLKIDAEGAENLIIKGGAKTLERFKPDILCEFLSDSKPNDAEYILKKLGYNFFCINEQVASIEHVENIVGGTNLNTMNMFLSTRSPESVLRVADDLNLMLRKSRGDL